MSGSKFQVVVLPGGASRSQFELFDSVAQAEVFMMFARKLGANVIAVAEVVEKKNMMSGLSYWEDKDTPNYCSPSSEAYWSM